MRIAVDAMGGDHAPGEIVRGALEVAREDAATDVILVGDQAAVQSELDSQGSVPGNVRVHPAGESIGMGEHPTQAVRRKRDSSLVLAGKMVKTGEADATFSAGNTGAAMAIATLDIGRLPGIERPAIATTLPTLKGRAILLDAGANVDCSPQHLLQWALLGAVYAEKVLKRTAPTVGLLNIGSEPGKGNELTKAAFTLLQSASLNFVGNVEGKDVFEGAADVIVCDGFAGNILLKSGEGVAELIVAILQRELAADAHIAESMDVFAPIFKRLMQRIDYSETGGAPLLGIEGVSIIGHGRSRAKAIANGIRAAREAAASGYVAATREALSARESESA
ncbi:MAG: phosphate acyltransferase PlsX [Armatimonadota bacterium]|nr:phosphate acyltransferase PlsX [Armatimonadota bacterium]